MNLFDEEKYAGGGEEPWFQGRPLHDIPRRFQGLDFRVRVDEIHDEHAREAHLQDRGERRHGKDACGEEGGRSDENTHALSVNGRVWFLSTLGGGEGRRWPSTNVLTSAETQQRRRQRQRLYWRHENKQPRTCIIHASIRTHFSLSRYLPA